MTFRFYPRRPLVPMLSPLDAPPAPQRNMRFKIVNYEDIPLERLRPHLDAREVERAIERAILCGVRRLGGVRIWEEAA